MLRETMIYGLATIASRIASFLLLPLYTHALTPADYGVLQLLDMTLDIVSIAFNVGATAGFMRYYFLADTVEERRHVVFGVFALNSGLAVAGSLLLQALAVPVDRHLLHGTASMTMLRQAGLNFALISLPAVPLILMQAQRRAGLFATFAVAKTVLQILLNILFLVPLRLGPLGVLYSTAITSTVIGLAAAWWMLRTSGMHTTSRVLAKLYRFGVPYQIGTIATFFLQFGDRFFLVSSRGAAAVGIYGLAYQFGFLFDQVALGPFFKAWIPRRYSEASWDRARRDASANDGLLYMTLLGVVAGVGLSLLVRPVLMVMASPPFRGAADIAPIVVLAFLIQGWSSVAQFGIDLAEQPRYVTIAAWVSAAAIFGLYELLIPRYGAMGAAVATCIAFVIRFLLLIGFAQRIQPFRYEWMRPLAITVLGIVVVAAAKLTPQPGFIGSLFVTLIALAAFSLITWYALVPPANRTVIARRAVELWSRIRLLALRRPAITPSDA